MLNLRKNSLLITDLGHMFIERLHINNQTFLIDRHPELGKKRNKKLL